MNAGESPCPDHSPDSSAPTSIGCSFILRLMQDILRNVQNRSPLQVFRSETQRRLLIELFFDRDERRTLSDLARALDVDPTTVMREIDRLADSGLIVEERVGRARSVQIDESSPYAAPLRQLLGIGLARTESTTREERPAHGPRGGRHDRRPLPSSRQQP